jgi:1,4-dihydroxy-2-naphthoyl-CoA hydrolase
MKPIWFKLYELSEVAKYIPNTMMEHLGIEITEIGPDFLRGRMPVDKRVHQIYGNLHGGASVTLAETLGSFAATLTLDLDKQFCVGQEINANHLRGVSSGYVTGTARPIYIGGTSQVWGIEIYGDNGKLVCISRITMAVRNNKQ